MSSGQTMSVFNMLPEDATRWQNK